MKKAIKRLVPNWLKPTLKHIYNQLAIRMLFAYDRSIFRKNYDSDVAQLIFHTHQIEKGLSHAKFRQGFGLDALRDLHRVMDKIADKNSIEYQNALSALKEYLYIHKKFDLSRQKQVLGDKIVKEIDQAKSTIGGSEIITKKSKEQNAKLPLDELMANRYSIREYSDEPVNDDKICNAIKIATKTPTACNRQSPRVAIIKNTGVIEKALQLQGGVNGYAAPPCLLLVTAENKAYLSASERHQSYIDGGLFAMSLLLALEFESLAAVPLHTMFDKKNDLATRRLLSIPKSESLIAYIAVGNLRDENKVAKSFRYPIEKITRIIQ
jgi:nitroreductase